MAQLSMTGTRIRDRRMDAALRQADLAQAVGISPSYLNLIEHNKRRIGGKLLSDLAQALGVEPGVLTQGADLALVDQLRGAAADFAAARAEIDRIEEFAARYPGWAAVMDQQSQRIARLETQLREMSDRMAHDPQLAEALHDVISAVTSIRSTAGILVDDDRIDRDWQRRFHGNIHDESVRLAEKSEALITYLDAPRDQPALAGSPLEEATDFMAQTGFHVAEMETGNGSPAQVAAGAGISAAGQSLLLDWLNAYAARARAMPLDTFAPAAKACGYDPLRLAATYAATIGDVLQRLATLPSDDGHPPTGLVTCDASGAVTFVKSTAGFAFGRQAGGCPLWPLYQAMSQPGHPIKAEVALPDAATTRFMCYAVTETFGPLSYDIPPLLRATMLVFPDPPPSGLTVRPVGLTCRICPRKDCAARREPAVA